MARKTIIFGNGLGMAIDPAYFSLDRAIGEVWNESDLLDEASKKLVCDCLPGEGNDRPHSEGELDILQLALSACDFLGRIGESRIHWLSEDGLKFPVAVRKFIYHTALKFHGHPNGLPAEFVDSLAEFIRSTNSHVATLNYDNLLYQPLIEREVLKGYSGALVDGFYSTGFDPDNLERKYGRTFGYYLHLHGSPLFIDREDITYKLQQCDLADQDTGTLSSHIVLTHFKHKPTVISASALLASYWQKLLEAISESSEVILFGYSGEDDHLNVLLRAAADTRIRIVEWVGASDDSDRVRYWSELLSQEIELVRLQSILDFRDWNESTE